MKKSFLIIGALLGLIAPLARAAISISVASSRPTGGVAPLAVHFDATATTGLADNSYLDATFAWDFDAANVDPNGHYRKAAGFVCGHVFDQPGKYTVRLVVTDKSGQTASQDIPVTVTAFSGTTYYVAANGSDSNPGTSTSAPLLSADFALNKGQPYTQILFRRGDTFNVPNLGISIGGRKGPVIVGSYGDPSLPVPVFSYLYTGANAADITLVFTNDDWRIMDIAVRSAGTGDGYPTGVGLLDSATNSLLYRVEISQTGGGAIFTGNYCAIVECDMHNFFAMGIFSAGNDLKTYSMGQLFIGNRLHDAPDNTNYQHMYRLQGGGLNFVGFNSFGPNVVANDDTVTIRGNATKVVLYKNKIYEWKTTIQPQNKQSGPQEYEEHILVDSNQFVGTTQRFVAMGVIADDVVIRNNVYFNYSIGMSVEDGSPNVGPAQRVNVYNNTIINNTASSQFTFVSYSPTCSDLNFYNNLMFDNTTATGNQASFFTTTQSFDPTKNVHSDYNRVYGSKWSASTGLFIGQSLANWRSSTGQDINSAFADPKLTGADPAGQNFAVPAPGSSLIDAGLSLGAKFDFYGNQRDALTDIGAVEGTSLIPPDNTPPARPKGLRFQ